LQTFKGNDMSDKTKETLAMIGCLLCSIIIAGALML